MDPLLKLLFVAAFVLMLYRARKAPQLWRNLLPAYRYGRSMEPNTVTEAALDRADFPAGFAAAEAELDHFGYRFSRILDILPPHMPSQRLFIFADDAGHTNAMVSFAPDATRSSVSFATRFTDDFDLNTTTPTGQTIDAAGLSMRFARTLEAAARYHIGQVAAAQARGRLPLPVKTLDDFRAAAAVSARKFRPVQIAPYVAYYRRSLIHLALAMALPFVMLLTALLDQGLLAGMLAVGWIANTWALSYYVRWKRVDFSSATGAIDDTA